MAVRKMKILLVDTDSKIPNLALMKLSTFHKQSGDFVEIKKLKYSGYPHNKKPITLEADQFDKVFVSTIFTVNKNMVIIDGNDNVEFGGTGYDLATMLPGYIDRLDEDYSIYPEHNSSYGFITRGCPRNCWFCFVPEKEGKLIYYRDWHRIVQHKETYFLDNNFLAYSRHKKILSELIDAKVKCQFNQGLDIRLIDDENAELLSNLHYIKEYIFAFDNSRHEKMINHGVQTFKKYVPNDWRMKMFVYTHPKMDIDDVLFRINWCRSRKIFPYLMRDKSCWLDKNRHFYIDLAAYCNQPKLFKNMSFEEFIFKRHPKNKNRASKSLTIYEFYLGAA